MRKKFISMMFVAVMTFILLSVQMIASAALKTVEMLDGMVSITDSLGKGSGGGTDYTVTAKGSLISKATNNITITNETDKKAQIKFDYTVDKYSVFTIGGSAATSSGSYSATIEAGGTIVIVLTSNSGFSNTTATLTLSNIECTTLSETSEITIEYDNSMGSVTAGGTAIDSESTITVGADGMELIATPASGNTFVAWVYEDGKLISQNATYKLEPIGNVKIKAIFSNDTPYFIVDDAEDYIYGDLATALTVAEAKASATTVILACDGTLPSGEYVVPKNVTLLVPFDENGTLYRATPESTGDSYTIPTAYRTLKMASGAKITVNGEISISAKQSADQQEGIASPTVAYGYVVMDEGSSIIVNNGGTLYVWGFISGQGTVTAKSGATVYECFQITDWRGGNAITNMLNNKERVFPMSQYYVQNIEVPLTLEAGAVENGYLSAYISKTLGLGGFDAHSDIPFIGTNGMFRQESGSITKDYDENTDRLIISVDGILNMSSLSLSMELMAIGGAQTVNSSNYTLPVNGNITLDINSGSKIYINQEIALLPGGVINVNEGAECIFAVGAKAFIYDNDEWGGYCAPGNLKFIPLQYAPGRKYTRTEADLTDAEVYIAGLVDAVEGFVYVTESGANVRGAEGGKVTLKAGADTSTYQATYASSDKSINYHSIPITTAKLKNANGEFADMAGACYPSYIYKEGKWIPDEEKATHTNIVEGAVVAATCTEDGYSEKTYCSACNAVIKEYEVLPATGHDEVSHEGKAATCNEGGWKEYVTCTKCDYTTYEEIAALGHDEVDHEAKAATCTEVGWDAYVTCSRCDYSTKVEIPALGHDEVAHEGKTATCTESGWKAYETCTRCDYTTYETVAALGHDEVDHDAKDATCTDIGWDAYVTCTRCDYTTYEEIAALGHDEVDHESKAATCTEIGWDAYVTCTRCDYSTKVEIPALGHDEVAHEGKTATCTESGWKAYVTCTRCDYTTYETVAALGHDEVDHDAKDATCTEGGWKAYVTCTRCDYTTYEEIAALGHDEVDHDAKDATCTEIGWDAYVTCTRCDYSTYNEIAALGHDEVNHDGKDATCTEGGWKAYETCTRCDYTTYEELAALGHDEVDHEAKDATCTESGWKAYETCTRCDYTTYETVDALGHDEVDHEAKDATCTENGWDAYVTCTRCDYSTYNEIAALGHDEVNHDGKDATCTEGGWKAYETCTRCDYTTYEEIAALGHDEVNHDGKDATCTESGWKAYETCTRCDYTTYETVEALGHDEVDHEAKDATCTENGWDAYVTCSRCDYSTKVEIPALGHDEVAHEGKTATCTESGWKAYETCTRCDYSTYNEIAALGHDEVSHDGKDATCTEGGWKAYETCTRCDYTTYETVDALGHDEVNHDAKDATCTENGWDAYVTCTRCDYSTYNEIAALGHNYNNLICDGCGCKKIATSTQYSIVNGNIELNTSLITEVEESAYVITAIYDGSGKMVHISLNIASDIKKVSFPSESVAKVKVLVWNGLLSIKPASFAEEILIK